MKLNINFKRIRNTDRRVDGLMLFKGIGNFLCLDTHLKVGNRFFQNGCLDAYDPLKITIFCFSEENYILLQLLHIAFACNFLWYKSDSSTVVHLL